MKCWKKTRISRTSILRKWLTSFIRRTRTMFITRKSIRNCWTGWTL